MTPKTCFPELLVDKTIKFVKAREKETGGFGATPLLPATVEDTYHAIRILELIEQKTENKKLVPKNIKKHEEFLREREHEVIKSARTMFQIAKSMNIIGIEPNKKILFPFLEKRLSQNIPLEEVYYCARIYDEILNKTFLCPSWIKDIKRWRTAKQLWMLIYSIGKKDISKKAYQEYIRWFQECQNYDGGFGFMPGTTSYIENTHLCLRALSWLNGSPKDRLGARGFILACTTVRGGFSRIQGAAPFLDATWHGIAALSYTC